MNLLSLDVQRAKYSRMVYESGQAAAEIGFWLLDPNQATKVDESKVTCPVLIIAGSKDRITPVTVIRNTAKKYKAVSTFKEYPDHAHSIILETDWEKVAEDIEAWLKNQLKNTENMMLNRCVANFFRSVILNFDNCLLLRLCSDCIESQQ